MRVNVSRHCFANDSLPASDSAILRSNSSGLITASSGTPYAFQMSITFRLILSSPSALIFPFWAIRSARRTKSLRVITPSLSVSK